MSFGKCYKFYMFVCICCARSKAVASGMDTPSSQKKLSRQKHAKGAVRSYLVETVDGRLDQYKLAW